MQEVIFGQKTQTLRTRFLQLASYGLKGDAQWTAMQISRSWNAHDGHRGLSLRLSSSHCQARWDVPCPEGRQAGRQTEVA